MEKNEQYKNHESIEISKKKPCNHYSYKVLVMAEDMGLEFLKNVDFSTVSSLRAECLCRVSFFLMPRTLSATGFVGFHAEFRAEFLKVVQSFCKQKALRRKRAFAELFFT